MKRSLISGAALIVAIVLVLSIMPTAAKNKHNDGQVDGAELIQTACFMTAQMDAVPIAATASPKIKENDGAFGGIEEECKEETPYITYYTEEDIVMLAELLYNECRGVESMTEQACVVWTVLNRVDASDGESIYDIVTAKDQFAYSHTPLWDNLLWLSEDVLSRWNAELNGETSVGRVLPSDYKWFRGDGQHNHFRNAYKGSYDIWDYSLPSPYES